MTHHAAFNTDWSNAAYKEAGRDFDLMSRAVAFLRLHYKIEKPDAEDVKWAAEYIKDYDRRPNPQYTAA